MRRAMKTAQKEAQRKKKLEPLPNCTPTTAMCCYTPNYALWHDVAPPPRTPMRKAMNLNFPDDS